MKQLTKKQERAFLKTLTDLRQAEQAYENFKSIPFFLFPDEIELLAQETVDHLQVVKLTTNCRNSN